MSSTVLMVSAQAGHRYLPDKKYCVDEYGARSMAHKCIGKCCNMAYRDFTNTDLRGLDLRGASLYRSNLQGVDFTRTHLHGTSLAEANIAGANFLRAKWREADFREAVYDASTLLPFSEETIEKFLMREDRLRGLKPQLFAPARSNTKEYYYDPLRKQCISRKYGASGKNRRYLGECGDASYMDLQRVNLRGKNLAGISFYRSNLSGVDFTRANVWGVFLREANLRETNFRNVYRFPTGKHPKLRRKWSKRKRRHYFRLNLLDSRITKKDRRRVEKFLREIEEMLPHRLKRTLNRTIFIKFKRLDDRKKLRVPSCKAGDPNDDSWKDNVYAQVSRSIPIIRPKVSEIRLHHLLKREIVTGVKNSRTFSCGHKNFYRLAQAKVVHELAHLYDYETGRSHEGIFLHLKNWTSAFILPGNDQKSILKTRSPNPYEYTSPAESFAVNFEFFVMDEEFFCRRPATHRYFEKIFRAEQHPKRKCKLNNQVSIRSPIYPDLVTPATLDPKRVYEVHYVLADKSSAIESSWGHSMVRLVMCRPDRKKVGPACLRDTTHHIMVSYRANIFDLALSRWKGLTGGYPSQMFLMNLEDTVEEYTKRELRSIISVPLKVTAEEKEMLVYRILEQYWEYLGRYYFLSNNCATESMEFLKGVVDEKKIQELSSMSPFGLYEDLIDADFLDDTVLNSWRYARSHGYFFLSQGPRFERSFRTIRRISPHMRYKSLKSYIKRSTARNRMRLYQSMMKSLPSSIDPNLITGSFSYLESLILTRWTKRLMEATFKKIDDGAMAASLLKHVQKLSEYRALETIPASNDYRGYGIPLVGEAKSDGSARSKKIASIQKELKAWFQREFRRTIQEIERTHRNVLTLKQAIKVD